jgi:hypothetical protein
MCKLEKREREREREREELSLIYLVRERLVGPVTRPDGASDGST